MSSDGDMPSQAADAGGRHPPNAINLLGGRSVEAARLLLLAGAATWLLWPFANNRQMGAGDALWYANMLADFVLQWRAGVFPVFAGQTIHAFNGAVYPLRVAPLYQHLAGIIDLLTGRRLGFFALQHLVVIACGGAGIFGCYSALCAIAPRRRWPAAALAILYLSCPGVLATVYTQDLYMTWTTIPLLPLAVFGVVRTFQKDTLASQLWLAAPLAALWWAHSPIALWMTGIAAFSQAVRLAKVRLALRAGVTRPSLRLALAGALAFILLAQYPFVSVASLHSSGTTSAVLASLAQPENIFANIRSVFPAVLFPLSAGATKLSDLQLGYSLWALFLFGLVNVGWMAAARWGRRIPPVRLASDAPRRLLLTCSLVLLLLLTPLPLTGWLWAHFPEVINRITLYWPMQRFYPILAAILVFAGQLSEMETGLRGVRRTAAMLLVLSCAWSFWESRQFIRAGQLRTASASVSETALLPENLVLMNHSYGLFPALPPTFSNGVMDPEAETRLLTSDSRTPARGGQHFLRRPRFLALHGTQDANPGILDLRPVLHLEPSQRYTLQFEFNNHDYYGVLQLVGRTFFRQYLLPASGEPLAFGTAPDASHSLPLWSTDPRGDDVTLRFIPTQANASPLDYADFGRVALNAISPVTQQVTLLSLVPYRVAVHSPAAGWLETPRMYMPGYAATIDGRNAPVTRSPRMFAMIPVTAAARIVELRFDGTIALRISYWTALLSWLAVGIAAAVHPAMTSLSGRRFPSVAPRD